MGGSVRDSVWVIEHREWVAVQQLDCTVSHVSSTRDRALEWMRDNPPDPPGFYALLRERVDGPIVQDHQIEFYGRSGTNRLKHQPKYSEEVP